MDKLELLLSAGKLLNTLSSILDREREALGERNDVALTSVADQKQSILNEIALIEPKLIELFEEASLSEEEDTGVESLRDLLAACRDKNRINGQLAASGLNVMEKSIATLESLMQIGRVRTYDAEGRRESGVAKRNIGVA